MRDFAFIESSAGRLFVGWGPFVESSARDPSRPAFYAPDYFLEDPAPWKHPASTEELTADELKARLSAGGEGPPQIAWEPLRENAYRPLFEGAHAALARGEFQKIVPVVFERGRLHSDHDEFVRHLVSRLARIRPPLRRYGYRVGNRGFLGASPELLFAKEGPAFRTMALAGTRPLAQAGELLDDPKERAEHKFVVEDIGRRLEPHGRVDAGPVEILEMPRLAHLVTRIRFTATGAEPVSFAGMIRHLHPTAALGVWPRNEAGRAWLRRADEGVGRWTFGAPFGWEDARGEAVCLVAIRNVRWEGDRVSLGAGSGLLRESVFEREWTELANKRDQVKVLFGLTEGCAPEDITSDLTSARWGGDLTRPLA